MNDVLVVGDSWASAVVADDSAHGGWPQLLDIPPGLRQGVSGSTAQQWAADFDGRLSRAKETPARVVVISLLGNDAMQAMQDGMLTAAEVEAGLRSVGAVVRALAVNRRVIVLLYTNPYSNRDGRSGVLVAMLNAALLVTCPQPVEFFDTNAVLTYQHFDGEDIHPNLAGHTAIADGLRQMISANTNIRQTDFHNIPGGSG